MIKKGFKGRCQKRQMKKCKEVVRTYGAIQLAYAERLEQEDSIIEFQCNVMLSGDRKSTRLNSSHTDSSRMPSSA